MESVKWAPGASEAFARFIHAEMTAALTARSALEAQWRRYLVQYRAPKRTGLKSVPFEGASNYELPITATDVDQYFAKFMQSLHADPDFWVVQTDNPNWIKAAKPIQNFLAILDKTILKMWRVNKRVIMETVKLGTGIYEHGWLYERRPVNIYDENGKIMRATKVVSRPFVDHVRLTDFLIPPYAYHVDPDEQGGAPWVAKRVELTREQLLAMATVTDPFVPNIGKQAALDIINWATQSQQPMDDTIQTLDYDKAGSSRPDYATDANNDPRDGAPASGSASLAQKITLWEVHARWDVTETNPEAATKSAPSDLVVLMHLPTLKMIRAIYNPYHHGKRPFEVIRFFPSEGFYGIGVCEQDEIFQEMGSELHNYLYDNVLLGNATMMAAKAGANIAPGEPIYPGKIWITDGNPGEEIKAFQMGQGAYPGLQSLMAMVDSQKNRRSGISDLQVGNIDGLPGRTPATSVQALLAESNRRPDLTLKDMRYEGLSTIGLRLIQLCRQFISSPVDLDGKKYLTMALQALGQEDGAEVVQKFVMPMEDPELGLGIEISAASATANKDMARQQLTGLLTMVGQTYPQIIQMAQMGMQAQGTPIAAIANKGVEAISALLERTMEQYDVPDASRLVPQLDAAGAVAGAAAPVAGEQGLVPAGPLPPAGGAGGGMESAGGV